MPYSWFFTTSLAICVAANEDILSGYYNKSSPSVYLVEVLKRLTYYKVMVGLVEMKKYSIKVKDSGAFERALKALFKRGYVFTEKRVTTVEFIKQEWRGWTCWRHIRIGYAINGYGCKRVLHAGETAGGDSLVLGLQAYLKIEKEL